jgi:monoamine oxidase
MPRVLDPRDPKPRAIRNNRSVPFDRARGWGHSAFGYAAPDLDSLESDQDFDYDAAYAHPNDTPTPLTARDSGRVKRVCIVGGGIAGLAAAYELLDLGHDVTLLEASSRFGGRIYTHYFADGTYGELGAMRIPENHQCVWHYINDFGLPTRPFLGENPQGWCLFREAGRMRRWEWDETWQTHYKLVQAVTPPTAKQLVQQLAIGAGTLTTRNWWESLSNDLADPWLHELEATTLGQHARGLPGTPGRLLSDEQWEFAGRTTHHIWLERCSLLHWLREGTILDLGEKSEIVGGMDRLTREFLRRIRRRWPTALCLASEVLSIDCQEVGADVTWRQARRLETESGHFDYVICTAPAPATVRIRFNPELPPHKREALTNLSYISAGKTIMRCSERHWEVHDDIYGGTSVTDRPNQQCWYPSDNRKPADEAAADHLTVELMLDPTRDLLEGRVELIDSDLESEERSHAPAVFLAAYLWGTNARRFASLTDAQRDDLICRSVAELHEHNDEYLDDVVHVAWDAQTNPGGGAFAFFAPGEQARYQAGLCAPLPTERPRVFFAGEHVGIVHGWVQSSIQSALAAVIDVVEAP